MLGARGGGGSPSCRAVHNKAAPSSTPNRPQRHMLLRVQAVTVARHAETFVLKLQRKRTWTISGAAAGALASALAAISWRFLSSSLSRVFLIQESKKRHPKESPNRSNA